MWCVPKSRRDGLKCSFLTSPSSETKQEVVDAVTKLDVLHFTVSLLGRSTIVPESVQEVAAQCLHALTEDNDPVIEKIVGNLNYLSLLMELVNDTDISSCLKTIFICGMKILSIKYSESFH